MIEDKDQVPQTKGVCLGGLSSHEEHTSKENKPNTVLIFDAQVLHSVVMMSSLEYTVLSFLLWTICL